MIQGMVEELASARTAEKSAGRVCGSKLRVVANVCEQGSKGRAPKCEVLCRRRKKALARELRQAG